MKYSTITLQVAQGGTPVGTVVLDPGIHRRLHHFAKANDTTLVEFIARAIVFTVGPETVESHFVPEIISKEDRHEWRRQVARRKAREATS